MDKEPEAPAAAPAAGISHRADLSPKPLPTRRVKPRVQKLDKQGRAQATGRRKNAVARVWLKPGRGAVTGEWQAIKRFTSPGRRSAWS